MLGRGEFANALQMKGGLVAGGDGRGPGPQRGPTSEPRQS
jgi:hypothetical protein